MTPVVYVSRVSLWKVQMILTNDAVPEPVGGSRNSNALGADGELEDLSNNHPACGTPGARKPSAKVIRETLSQDANSRCKEEDEQAHKDDQDVACCLRVLRYGADNGDYELADCHADSSPNEQGATTELLNGVE